MSTSSSKGKKRDATLVSLPDYLRDVLLPLVTLETVPEDLRTELEEFVKPASEPTTSAPQEIPYSLLQRVSRWSQTVDGKIVLKNASLGMHPTTNRRLDADDVCAL